MTDNRTNEPTEAMILAGLNAYSSKGLELDGYDPVEEYPSLEMWGDRFASQIRAALVAAQGAAPQAECDCGAGPGSAVCKKVCATRAPVVPSSGVDEGKLAKVIDKALIRHGERAGMSNQERWDASDDISRAVVAWLKGQGRGSEV